MIGAVPEPEVSPVLVPVTAEDYARRKRRLVLAVVAGALAIAAAAGYVYKRSVDPLHAQESYDAGERLFASGRYSQAILSLDRAIDLKPDLAAAYYLRARARAAEEETGLALRDFSAYIRLLPSDPRGYLGRGQAYFNLKNFAAAVADSTRAVALDPKIAAAYNLRGMAQRSAGNPKPALEDFTQAVTLDPNADNYYQRASTYQMLGEHRLALSDFNQVVEYLPDQAQGYFARSESRRALGDLPGATADRRRGLELDAR
jgi:tetratricopeptide (TPR) repeat protein